MSIESNKADLGTIHRRFQETSYSTYLADCPRWADFMPSHISNERWRSILHADASGSEHGRLMLGLTTICLGKDTDNSFQLDESEKVLLKKAMLMQDWGKSFDSPLGTGGDIGYERITISDKEQRKTKFLQLYDEFVPDGDVKERYILAATIYDKSSKLGRVFDVIKRLSYLRTAIIACNQAQNFSDDSDLTDSLNLLAVNVISNQLIPLIQSAEEFSVVKNVLTDLVGDINYICTLGGVLQKNDTSQHTIDAFERTVEIWTRSHSFNQQPETYQRRAQSSRGHRRGIYSEYPAFTERFINDKDKLKEVVDAIRTVGNTIVLTSGSFDLIHIGHARYLEKAAEYGDVLIIGVDSDNKVKQRKAGKGKSRPVIDQQERLQMLSHLRGVGIVTLKEVDDPQWSLIKLVRPDVLIVTAETYSKDEIDELEANYCGQVVILEPQALTSTSARIRKLELEASTDGDTLARLKMGQRVIELLQMGYLSTEEIIAQVRKLMSNGNN